MNFDEEKDPKRSDMTMFGARGNEETLKLDLSPLPRDPLFSHWLISATLANPS